MEIPERLRSEQSAQVAEPDDASAPATNETTPRQQDGRDGEAAANRPDNLAPVEQDDDTGPGDDYEPV